MLQKTFNDGNGKMITLTVEEDCTFSVQVLERVARTWVEKDTFNGKNAALDTFDRTIGSVSTFLTKNGVGRETALEVLKAGSKEADCLMYPCNRMSIEDIKSPQMNKHKSTTTPTQRRGY